MAKQDVNDLLLRAKHEKREDLRLCPWCNRDARRSSCDHRRELLREARQRYRQSPFTFGAPWTPPFYLATPRSWRLLARHYGNGPLVA